VLSTRFKDPDGTWFEAYVADGGYLAARKALTTMTAQQVIDEVSKSILRGLGSAGFSRGPARRLRRAGERHAAATDRARGWDPQRQSPQSSHPWSHFSAKILRGEEIDSAMDLNSLMVRGKHGRLRGRDRHG